MDLLHSVLRTCDAEAYVDNFKNNGINCSTLKILSDEDLQIIGVMNTEARSKIIKHVSNLQIPAERNVEIVVNNQYAMLVLNQMSVQLHKHFANLSYALKRKDTDICNIKVTYAVDCLRGSLTSLERKLTQFDQKIFKHEKKKRKMFYILAVPSIIVTAAVIFFCKKIGPLNI